MEEVNIYNARTPNKVDKKVMGGGSVIDDLYPMDPIPMRRIMTIEDGVEDNLDAEGTIPMISVKVENYYGYAVIGIKDLYKQAFRESKDLEYDYDYMAVLCYDDDYRPISASESIIKDMMNESGEEVMWSPSSLKVPYLFVIPSDFLNSVFDAEKENALLRIVYRFANAVIKGIYEGNIINDEPCLGR